MYVSFKFKSSILSTNQNIFSSSSGIMKSFTIFSSIYGYNIFNFSISLTIFCKLLALYLQIKFIAHVEIMLLYLAFSKDDKSLFSSVLKSFF